MRKATMIAVILIVFSVALSEATMLTTIEDIIEDAEEDKVACPITGYTVSRYTYSKCSGSQSVPMGCVSSNGKRYNFGEEFIDTTAKYRCVREDRYVWLKPIACVLNGKVVEIGQKAKHGNVFVVCDQMDNGLRLVIIGCADPTGQEVPIGSTFRRGKFIYMCNDYGDRVGEKAVACLADGKLLKLGQQMRSGDFIVKCQRKGESSANLDIIGCSNDKGGLIHDGETTIRDTIIYKCEEKVRDSVVQFILVPIGCRTADYKTNTIRDYKIGETFLQKFKDDIAFTMECRKNNGTAGPVTIGCTFIGPGDLRTPVPLGCGTEIDSHVLICKLVDGKKVLARKKKITSRNTAMQLLNEAGVRRC